MRTQKKETAKERISFQLLILQSIYNDDVCFFPFVSLSITRQDFPHVGTVAQKTL